MLARLLALAASVALLAAPAAGVGTFTYRSFTDETCSADRANGVVTVAAVNGTCQPLVSSDPAVTPATIFGLTGLTYGKVFCNSVTGVTWIEGFSDAGCATMLGMRAQANGTCVGRSQFVCSDANATPPPTVPTNYQVRMECEGSTDCGATSGVCITSAVPANTCIGITERVAPLLRSEYTGCNGTGDIVNFVYNTPDCTGEPFVASKAPNNVCKTDLKLSCGAPAAANPPAFPTIAQGYSVNTRQCDDAACSANCLVDARRLQTCFSLLSDDNAPESFSTSCAVGGAQTVTGLYSDATCTALNFGIADITDATCQGTKGTTSCALNAAYPPTFAGSFTEWRGVLGCPNTTLPTVDLLIPALDTCVKLSATNSAKLSKDGTDAAYNVFPFNGNCAGFNVTIRAPNGQCTTLGQGPDSGIISTVQQFPSAPPSLSYKGFHDERCDAAAMQGEVTIAVADGSCQPLTVVSGGSAAAVFGLTGAMYGRAWCGPNSATGVQIQAFSDATCATMLGARMQLNSVCADGASITCSYLNPGITSAPAFPPATYAELKVCHIEAQCAGSSCASLALPTNMCVGLTSHEAPMNRSMMMVCAGDGTYKQFSYDTPNCSGAIAFASSLPLTMCKGPLLAMCPAAQQPMPTPAPVFPTVAGGYALTKRSCADAACTTTCAIEAFPLAVCRQYTDASGLNSLKGTCVNGGTGVVRSIYGGGSCASGSLEIGMVDPQGASCQDPMGAISCSMASPYADGPNYAGFVSRFRGSTCDANGPSDTILYPALNTCASLGVESIRLDCAGTQATDSYWNASTTCAGPAHFSHTGAANTCLTGGRHNGSAIFGCHNLFPGSLTMSKFHDWDQQCHSHHLVGTVTVAKADGTCQPLVSSDPNVSPASILGLTGLAYARAWCGGNSNEIMIQGYSDATCTTMLGVRRQIQSVCADHQTFTCSKLDTGLTPPALPATFAVINLCPPGSLCQSEDCAVVALPVNQCIVLTAHFPPLQRSQMMVCSGDGTHKLYNYMTPDCSGDVVEATQVDSGTCYDVFSATCPAQQQPMPGTPPVFPTQQGGYLMQTRACNSATCNSGCMISATQMATCNPEYEFGSFAASNKLVCVSAGTALVDVQYNDGACTSSALAFGNVIQQKAGASCMDAFGVFSCSTAGQNGNLPAFAGSVSRFADSTNCSTVNFPADIKLLPTLNTCTTFGNFSYELDCDAATNTAVITEWEGVGCAGTSRMHTGAQDTCIAVQARDGRMESIILDCSQMYPAGTGSGATVAAAAKSVASILAIVAAVVALML